MPEGARTSQPRKLRAQEPKLLHSPAHDWIKDSFGVLENPENRVFVESKVRGVCGYPCVCICVCHREMVGATSALWAPACICAKDRALIPATCMLVPELSSLLLCLWR